MKKTKEFYLSKDGIAKLQEELQELTTIKRKEVAEALKEAKELGDLSENSSWDDAKDRQIFIEGRIAEIENILRHTKLIKPQAGGAVAIGSRVKVKIADGEQHFEIVGSTEADPSTGKISNESPIGKALLGGKKGDSVEVEVPAGTMVYTIVDIG